MVFKYQRKQCVPSVFFAEVSWCDLPRAGLKSAESWGGGAMADCGSCWGIKRPSEVSNRLTVIYWFEHKINASNANQNDGGHLSYVGLSGGLGTTTLGK